MDINELKQALKTVKDIELDWVSDSAGDYLCEVKGDDVYGWLSRTRSGSPMMFYNVSEAKEYLVRKLNSVNIVIPSPLMEIKRTLSGLK